MNKIKNIFQNELFLKAFNTFIEVFCAYLILELPKTDLTSKTAIYGLIAGALGSALSVLINKVQKWAKFKMEELEEKDYVKEEE